MSQKSGLKPPSKLTKPSAGLPKPLSSIVKPSTVSLKLATSETSNVPLAANDSIVSEVGESHPDVPIDDFIIGDRVFVGGTKPGNIAFLGETQFAAGQWAGVVLDETVGKNDGSVNGIRYFQCEAKRGVFSKTTKLTRELVSSDGTVPKTPMTKSLLGEATPSTKLTTPITSAAFKTPARICMTSNAPKTSHGLTSSMLNLSQQLTGAQSNSSLNVGDRVIVSGTKHGVLRYLGGTDFAKGEWAGVELDEALGKNDGSVAGKRYFDARPLHGLFAPASKVVRVGVAVTALRRSSISSSRYGGLNRERSGSQESISSLSSVTSSASRSRVPKLGTKSSSITSAAATVALQKALKEKEEHVEQLLKERDLERSEIVRAAAQADEAEWRLANLQTEHDKLLEGGSLGEQNTYIMELESRKRELQHLLEEEKRKVEDLQFSLEEANIIREGVDCKGSAELEEDSAEKVSELEKLLADERKVITCLEEQLSEAKTVNSTLDKESQQFEDEQFKIVELATELTSVKEELLKVKDDLDRNESAKNKLQEEVENLCKNLSEKEEISNKNSTELIAVSGQLKSAEEKLQDYLLQFKEKEKKLLDFNEQVADLSSEKASLETNILQKEDLIKKLETEFNIEKDLHETSALKLNEASEESKKQEVVVAELSSNNKLQSAELENLRTELVMLKNASGDSAARSSEYEKLYNDEKERVKDTSERLNEEIKANKDLIENLQLLTVQQKTEIEKRSAEIEELVGNVKDGNKSFEQLKLEISQLEEKNKCLDQKIMLMEGDLQEEQKKLAAKSGELSEERNLIKKLEDRIGQNENTEKQLQDQIRNGNDEKADLKKKLQKNVEELDSLRSKYEQELTVWKGNYNAEKERLREVEESSLLHVETIEQLSTELNELSSKAASLETKLCDAENARKHLGDASRQKEFEMNEEIANLEKKIKEISVRENGLAQEVDARVLEVKSLRDEKEIFVKQLSAKELELVQLEEMYGAKVAEIEKKFNDAQSEKSQQETEFQHQLTVQVNEARQRGLESLQMKEEADAELIKLQEKVESLHKDLKNSEDIFEEINNRLKSEQEAKNDWKEKHNNIEAALANTKGDRDQLEVKLSEMLKHSGDSSEQMSILNQQLTASNRTIEDLNAQLSEGKQKMSRLIECHVEEKKLFNEEKEQSLKKIDNQSKDYQKQLKEQENAAEKMKGELILAQEKLSSDLAESHSQFEKNLAALTLQQDEEQKTWTSKHEELNKKLQNTIVEVNNVKEEKDSNQNELKKLHEKFTVSEGTVERLHKEQTELEEQLTKAKVCINDTLLNKEQLQSDLEKLKQDYDLMSNKKDKSHAKSLKQQNDEFEKKLKTIKLSAEEKFRLLEEEKESELLAVKAQHKEEMHKLQDRMSASGGEIAKKCEEEISHCKNKHEEEIKKIKIEVEESIKLLHMQLEEEQVKRLKELERSHKDAIDAVKQQNETATKELTGLMQEESNDLRGKCAAELKDKDAQCEETIQQKQKLFEIALKEQKEEALALQKKNAEEWMSRQVEFEKQIEQLLANEKQTSEEMMLLQSSKDKLMDKLSAGESGSSLLQEQLLQMQLNEKKLTEQLGETAKVIVEKDAAFCSLEQKMSALRLDFAEKMKSIENDKGMQEQNFTAERESMLLKIKTLENQCAELDCKLVAESEKVICSQETLQENGELLAKLALEKDEAICQLDNVKKENVASSELIEKLSRLEEAGRVLTAERDEIKNELEIMKSLVVNTSKEAEELRNKLIEERSLTSQLKQEKLQKIESSPDRQNRLSPQVNGTAESEKVTASGEVDFLNSVIVDMQRKNEALRHKIDVLTIGEMEDDDAQREQAVPAQMRLYCDICEQFDVHDTDDCPLQASDEPAETQYHASRDAPSRPYCENCECFGHVTEDCNEDETY